MVWRGDPWGHTTDPFDEFVRRMHKEVMRFFNEFEREFMNFTPMGFNRTGVREPLVDIFKEGNELVITIELPGVRKEDINLRFLDKRRLYINVESRLENNRKFENAIYVERSYARFERVIVLPYPVKPETARAKFNNGVLEVRVQIDESEWKKIEGVPVKIE